MSNVLALERFILLTCKQGPGETAPLCKLFCSITGRQCNIKLLFIIIDPISQFKLVSVIDQAGLGLIWSLTIKVSMNRKYHSFTRNVARRKYNLCCTYVFIIAPL